MFPHDENWFEELGDPLFSLNGGIRSGVVHPCAMTALLQATAWAAETGWDTVRTPHLFMGILSEPDIQIRDWGCRVQVNLNDLAHQFANVFHQSNVTPHKPRLHREFLSNNVIVTLRQAIGRAKTLGRSEIRLLDVLICILENPEGIVGECFAEVDISAEELIEKALEVELAGSHDELEI